MTWRRNPVIRYAVMVVIATATALVALWGLVGWWM